MSKKGQNKRGKKVVARKGVTIQVINRLPQPPYKEVLTVEDFTQ